MSKMEQIIDANFPFEFSICTMGRTFYFKFLKQSSSHCFLQNNPTFCLNMPSPSKKCQDQIWNKNLLVTYQKL